MGNKESRLTYDDSDSTVIDGHDDERKHPMLADV